MIPGIQLSTFKPLLGTKDGVREVFQRISAMGCKAVQLQGIGSSVPVSAIADALRKTGLKAVSVQEIYTDFNRDRQRYIRLNQAVGGIWLTVSRIPAQTEWRVFADDLKTLAKELSRVGQKLSFHPVYEDFPAVDFLLEAVPEMDICLDFYHLWRTGVSIPAWIQRYASRIPMAHFKDAVDGRMVPAGQGQVDWTGVVAACAQTDYGFVEQEAWEKEPFSPAQAGFEWLKGQIREAKLPVSMPE